ncbi:MAG: ketopantoate reductase family protein [Marmoricola sp.]
MRIAVIGAGGVGGYFGGQLAAAGHDVTFIARGRQLEALRTHGLRVLSDHAPVHLDAVEVTDDLAATAGAEVVVIAVKLWETATIARELAAVGGATPAILSLQNGVKKDDELRAALPDAEIWGGLCYISAAIEAPGVIRHNGALARIVFGSYAGAGSERARDFEQALRDAGVEVEHSAEIEEALWRKFVFLVGLSSVTSVARQPIGVLRGHEASRRLLRDVMAEVVDVARLRGVLLPADYADEQVAFCDTLPAQMSSSMLHDLTHGQRLELPWLGGGVVTMGEQVGVPTPVNRALAAALAPYVEGRPAGDH